MLKASYEKKVREQRQARLVVPTTGHEARQLMRIPTPFEHDEHGTGAGQLVPVEPPSSDTASEEESSEDDPTPRQYEGHPRRRIA